MFDFSFEPKSKSKKKIVKKRKQSKSKPGLPFIDSGEVSKRRTKKMRRFLVSASFLVEADTELKARKFVREFIDNFMGEFDVKTRIRGVKLQIPAEKADNVEIKSL